MTNIVLGPNVLTWPVGFGKCIAGAVLEPVHDDLVVGLSFKAVPDHMVGKGERGASLSNEEAAQIPDDAPSLFLRFADPAALEQHIRQAYSLFTEWKKALHPGIDPILEAAAKRGYEASLGEEFHPNRHIPWKELSASTQNYWLNYAREVRAPWEKGHG